ncbi:ATP-dependent DNA helicase Pif1-like [Oratosquilla oratoria]|uniref:ATP-dependent DNA helicase Pif1-like n=1 Tax=Oratosquilla oratoria TaxID=337810 RepID=UPI003F7739B1
MTKTSSLGRMRAVDTKMVESFYLRMLLTHKKSPTSYTDLRTVDGVLYDTFREQRAIYDAVMECVNNRRSGVFFLNAPGGTGKSFVLNLLLDTVRANSKIALAVASSGIAATILHGGRTAHNMFKIPIMEHNEVKPCSIKLNSELARLIKMTSLIVWDEVVMTNKNTITALDCTAKDMTGNKHCFMDGIPFVCLGDFRQILPVIRGGGKNEELKYNIKNAFFWEDLRKFKLVQNVRLKAEDKVNRRFAEN